MAGDWIKFEVATLDKPEVRQMARVLGVKHGEALELLLRFWVWIDANSVDGHVDGLVEQDVDDLLHCNGFCGAMKLIGWLSVDNSTNTISIPNADRHTTESAKKRALSSKRQREWRNSVDGHVDAGSVTKALPEKRREEVNPGLSVAVDNFAKTKTVGNKLPSNPNPQTPQWWKTDEGITAKGQEMGMSARPGESFGDFRKRLFEEQSVRERVG
jgi:hypothetical protein